MPTANWLPKKNTIESNRCGQDQEIRRSSGREERETGAAIAPRGIGSPRSAWARYEIGSPARDSAGADCRDCAESSDSRRTGPGSWLGNLLSSKSVMLDSQRVWACSILLWTAVFGHFLYYYYAPCAHCIAPTE